MARAKSVPTEGTSRVARSAAAGGATKGAARGRVLLAPAVKSKIGNDRLRRIVEAVRDAEAAGTEAMPPSPGLVKPVD